MLSPDRHSCCSLCSQEFLGDRDIYSSLDWLKSIKCSANTIINDFKMPIIVWLSLRKAEACRRNLPRSPRWKVKIKTFRIKQLPSDELNSLRNFTFISKPCKCGIILTLKIRRLRLKEIKKFPLGQVTKFLQVGTWQPWQSWDSHSSQILKVSFSYTVALKC